MGTNHPEDAAFGTCEVTGEVLPRNALVQFQGKLVSERGKQILLEQIQSGEQVTAPALSLPGPGRRLLGSIADNFILSILANIISYAVGYSIGRHLRQTGASQAQIQHAIYSMLVWGAIGGLVLNVAYYALTEFFWGKTLFKLVCREKVVSVDGDKATFGQCLARELIRWSGGVFSITFVAVMGQAGIIPGEAILILWLLIDWLFIVSDQKDRRALHDRLARTRVVFSDGRGGVNPSEPA